MNNKEALHRLKTVQEELRIIRAAWRPGGDSLELLDDTSQIVTALAQIAARRKAFDDAQYDKKLERMRGVGAI